MITKAELCRMIDVSTVRTDCTMAENDLMIELVKKHNCICASPMPWNAEYTVNALKDYPDIVVTGNLSFPSGGETTGLKVAAAKEMLKVGCRELDMVINVNALKSGMYSVVEDDIRAVVDAADGAPVKTIIEACYLTDDEIKRASLIAVSAGATFVKTNTGWGPKPTTVENVKLIRATIGDSAKIKASGGIRDIDTVLAMVGAGCTRFGIGIRSIEKFLKEAESILG